MERDKFNELVEKRYFVNIIVSKTKGRSIYIVIVSF